MGIYPLKNFGSIFNSRNNVYETFFFDVVCLCQLLEETKDTDAPTAPQNSQLTWKQGRQLLRQ